MPDGWYGDNASHLMAMSFIDLKVLYQSEVCAHLTDGEKMKADMLGNFILKLHASQEQSKR